MSASRRKKIKRFVIDTNVWISWCINGQLEWLTRYVFKNNLLIYASPLLVSELKKVINYPKIKKLLGAHTSHYINIIASLVLIREDKLTTVTSPDADDDYLFSLAVSVNAKALVCGDKLLLDWKESPVKLMTKHEFETLF